MYYTDKLVMTIKADDYDAGDNAAVSYAMVPGSQRARTSSGTMVDQSGFRIDSDGSVYTIVNNLDRETTPTFYFEVSTYIFSSNH